MMNTVCMIWCIYVSTTWQLNYFIVIVIVIVKNAFEDLSYKISTTLFRHSVLIKNVHGLCLSIFL